MDELTRERFLTPKPQPAEPPHPYALVLERQRILVEALEDAPRSPTAHRAERVV